MFSERGGKDNVLRAALTTARKAWPFYYCKLRLGEVHLSNNSKDSKLNKFNLNVRRKMYSGPWMN